MAGWQCADCGAVMAETGWFGGIVERLPDGSCRQLPHCESCYARYWERYEVKQYCDLCYRNLTARYEVWTDMTVLSCPTCGERQRIDDRDLVHLPAAKQERIKKMLPAA